MAFGPSLALTDFRLREGRQIGFAIDCAMLRLLWVESACYVRVERVWGKCTIVHRALLYIIKCIITHRETCNSVHTRVYSILISRCGGSYETNT